MIADERIVRSLLHKDAKVVKQEGETLFFTSPSGDIHIDEKTDIFNQRKWSVLRRLCYDFFVSEMKGCKEDALVLDVGMGQAQFRDLYKNMTVIGADYYPYKNVRVVCDFNELLPFKDSSFDVVFASNVLEHLPEPSLALGEYRRVLKPGGRIIAAVPFLLGVHHAPYDFHRYTHFMIERMLRDAGFTKHRVSILGTGADTYRQLGEKYFTLMRDSKDRSSTFLGKVMVWGLVHIAWGVQIVLDTLITPLSRRIGVTDKLPLGYGFVGEAH